MRSTLVIVVLAFTTISSVAVAQRPARQAVPVTGQSQLAAVAHRLVWTIDQAHSADRGRYLGLRSEALRFAQAVDGRHADSRGVENAFRTLRRELHSVSGVPSDAILDVWEQLVMTERRTPATRHHHRRGERRERAHAPVVVYQPPAYAAVGNEVYFEGSFENTPARFVASSAAHIKAECEQFLREVRVSNVDDIQVFGQSYRNNPSYWSRSQLCTIAAANARSVYQDPYAAVMHGTIESIPFRFEGTPMEIRQAVRTLIPELTRGLSVDNLTINGQRFVNGPSYWSAREVAALMEYNVPLPQGHGRYVAARY